MWQQLRKWWILRKWRWRERKQSNVPISFGKAVADVQDILVCLPTSKKEFRIARYALKFLPGDDVHHRITYIIPKAYSEQIPMRLIDRKIEYNGSSRDNLGRFTAEVQRQILDKSYQAAVDMNTTFDFGTSKLCHDSQAQLRIGFASEYSHLFYNIEIEKPEEQFLLERAYRNIHKLLSLVE